MNRELNQITTDQLYAATVHSYYKLLKSVNDPRFLFNLTSEQIREEALKTIEAKTFVYCSNHNYNIVDNLVATFTEILTEFCNEFERKDPNWRSRKSYSGYWMPKS